MKFIKIQYLIFIQENVFENALQNFIHFVKRQINLKKPTILSQQLLAFTKSIACFSNANIFEEKFRILIPISLIFWVTSYHLSQS